MLKASDTRRESIHPTPKISPIAQTHRTCWCRAAIIRRTWSAHLRKSTVLFPCWSCRNDFSSHVAIADAAAVHCEDQTKEEDSPPGLHCTTLRSWHYLQRVDCEFGFWPFTAQIDVR